MRLARYLGSVRKVEQFLDVIEYGIQFAYQIADEGRYVADRRKARKLVEDGVQEINYRFRFHAVGYEYVGVPGEVIRMDTPYIHTEAVQPAILQLRLAGWEGALDEFLSAHSHYRRGDNKAAMNEALKAFESTMKAILEAQDWPCEPHWQAKHLIQSLLDHELIPTTLGSYLNGIRTVLTDGVPALRNKQSGHGQGAYVATVPDYVAAFTLNLTASNIVFLMEANKAFGVR